MIHEEICTYEVCKLAKEKGFPQDVFGTCEMKSSCYLVDGRYYKDGCICPIKNAYTAPTQSLLQRWLREERKYAIAVFWDMLSKDYRYEIVKTIGVLEIQVGEKYNYSNPKGFDTYELALEDALAYSLKNLV